MSTLVLVAGGRVGVARRAVEAVLDRLSQSWPSDTVVVHGNAKRTDRYAGAWARDRGFGEIAVVINPLLDGVKEDAPKNRNTRMAVMQPSCLVAFPGGPGTRDMIEKAEAFDIPIYDVEIEGNAFTVRRLVTKGRAERIAAGAFA